MKHFLPLIFTLLGLGVASNLIADEAFMAPAPPPPTVQLRSIDCGIDDFTTNDIIRSTQPQNISGIIYYQWRFEELEAPFAVYEIISPQGNNPNFRLKWFDQIQYGRSYDVSVRLATNPGPEIGTYGPSCTIGLQPNVLSTQVEQQYASGFFAFCDVIGADAVGAADQYRWTFFDLSNTLVAFGDGNQRLLRLSKVPGLRLGATYIVSVFATVNGQESPAGTLRFLNTINTVPNTGLRNDIYPCGQTYPINSQVQAVEVCNAENYTWRFRNTSQPQPDLLYTRTDGSRFIRLEWVTGLIPGDTYDVDVRARQGQVTGDYSNICSITIGEATNQFWSNPISIAASREGSETLYTTGEESMDIVVFSNGGEADGGIVFDFTAAQGEKNVRFELYDLNGRLVAERRELVVGGEARYDWKIDNFTSGIYILRAIDGAEVISRKISVF